MFSIARSTRGPRWAALLPALAVLCLPAWGQADGSADVPRDPNVLVRRVVERELKAVTDSPERPRWRYTLRRETPSGANTRQMIETREGIVARYVAINDRPLTPKERQDDDKRLASLLSDPSEQQEKFKEQRKDAERVQNMIRALPGAFLYQYNGTEPGRYGQMLRLTFSPNPRFSPPTRETHIYRGMSGTMWIDAAEERLVRIDAELKEDVNIGWGIIGRLHRGGKFRLEQARVEPGVWMISSMELDFTGRALIFKSVKIRQKQTISDFQRVPPGLTLAQGVRLLRERDGQVMVGTRADSD